MSSLQGKELKTDSEGRLHIEKKKKKLPPVFSAAMATSAATQLI